MSRISREALAGRRFISAAVRSAPNAKELSTRSGTAARPPGLAVHRAQGSILRAPGHRLHGRQAHSRGTIHAGGPQLQTEWGAGRALRPILLYFAFCSLSSLLTPKISISDHFHSC